MIDADRFEAFVREYQDMVFATAVRLLGRAADAEDIAQSVFLKALDRFDELAASPTAAGWLKTVATNLCLNHLSRYRARWRLFSELDAGGDELEDGTYAATLPDSAAQPLGELLDDRDRQVRLERALRALPDHQRVPLVLFHFNAMSYQDIAATLGTSLAKVKSDIHRGRVQLKNALRINPCSRTTSND